MAPLSETPTLQPAIFLDRDGVLIEDQGPLVSLEGVRVLEGVPEGLMLLKAAGYRLVVVSNQTVVARGQLDCAGVEELERQIEARLITQGAPALDAFYYCPHHPKATLPEWRLECRCRKPGPGLLERAIRELGLDPARSFLFGDRLTDIAAGAALGCRTALLETGQEAAPLIETHLTFELPVPDLRCPGLLKAARWVLGEGQSQKGQG